MEVCGYSISHVVVVVNRNSSRNPRGRGLEHMTEGSGLNPRLQIQPSVNKFINQLANYFSGLRTEILHFMNEVMTRK